MRKILITGVNSYVGNSLADWLDQYPNQYEVHKISVRGDEWRNHDFSVYDSIVHVSGIAHQKETRKNAHLYYKINRDLTYEIAKKAKMEKVLHFIFLSSMSVYGLNEGIIDENTPLKPKTHYGKSKLEAEELILKLEDDQFRIAILRPPMIYGKDCPGNYQRLRWFALKTPIFPDIDNKRSMIHIDNLTEFIRKTIHYNESGVFFPQNKEYVCTSELVRLIGKNHNRNILFTEFFNPIIRKTNIPLTRKVFGNLLYDKILVENIFDYCINDIEVSITKTERA